MRKRMHGITLIELMIVVVIVTILAAVSYPNYREYAARAKRNEAKAALLKIASNQERVYLQTGSFTEDLTQLGFGTDPYTTDSDSYTVDVLAGADAAGFTAQATYTGTDAEKDKCKTFTINAQGVKGSAPYNGCWKTR